jgi:BTB/POZ domain
MIDPRAADSYDVKFLVGPQKRVVQGNKVGLAFTSTVFHRMFFSDFPNKNEIVVPDVDADAFEIMINSLSGRAVNIKPNNVAHVYYAAEKYDLAFLRQVCKMFIVNSTDSTNALSVLNTFQHYNEPDINEKCLSFILDDPLSFFKKPEFLDAPDDVIRCIFKPTYINCSTQDVKNALTGWMQNNGLEIKNDQKLFEAVKQKLKMTKKDLELKMIRQHSFHHFHYEIHSALSSEFTFDLKETHQFLQGFGLVMGKVSNEIIHVKIFTVNGLFCDLGKIDVAKKGRMDIVTIQDVFFEKILIFHDKLRLKVTFESNGSRPHIPFRSMYSCVSHLILSEKR